MNNNFIQTDIGVIPDDWEVKQLGELFEITSSKRVFQSEWRNFGVPFYRARELAVLGDQGYVDNDLFISEEMYSSYKVAYGVPNIGDMLVTGVGTLGKVYVVIDNHEFYFKDGNIIWFKILGKVVPEFLKQLYLTRVIKKQIEDGSAGTTVGTYTITGAKKTKIPFPPLPEQHAIATALSDVDALLNSLDALIAKKHLIKQGAMQELLHPKDNWVEKKLRDTAILKARIGWQGLTTAEYRDSGDYYLVTGTDFKGGFIDWDNCHFIDDWRYTQDKNIQLREHDVLVTKDGTIGKVALIQQLEKPATLNSGVFVLRPIDEAFQPVFFYYLLCSNIFTKFLGQLSAGSTINHLYQKDFVSFIYKTPTTIEEQTAIAEILSDMDAEISALEQKREKTRLLKQGMMQELLTGRIRLV